MNTNAENIGQYYQQDDRDKLDIRSAVLKYADRWPLFLGSFALAMFAAFMIDQCSPPVYRIQSKFLIKEENYSVDVFEDGDGGKNSTLPKGQKIANESIIIKSRSIAEDVLDRLPLDVEYYREGLFKDTELYDKSPLSVKVDWNQPQLTDGRMRISWSDPRSFELTFLDEEYYLFSPEDGSVVPTDRPSLSQQKYQFGDWIQFPSGRFLVDRRPAEREGSIVIKLRNRESLIQQYTGENLQVVPADKVSSILILSLEATQPYKGRDYLDVLMSVFLENELDGKNTIARNTIAFIDSQLSGISDSLHYAENKLEAYRSRNRTYNISSEGNTLYEKLSELEKLLSHERFKGKFFTNLQQYLAGEQYGEIVIPAGLGIDDPLLNKLLQDMVAFQADRSRLLATQTENSPTVIEVNRKIKDLARSITDALKSASHATELVIDELSRRIARIEGQFGKLPETEQDLLSMQRRYSLSESIYTFLLQRRAEASIVLASNAPSNKIIEQAVLNLMPMRLRPLLNYFLAAILGLLIPLAIMFVKDMFSVTINDPKQVEHATSARVIGYIGRNRKPSPQVVLQYPRARITEAFRALRANIDFLGPSRKQSTILITSSISGEGKSFCSMNLGSIYAACEKKTIVISCDLHKSFAFDSLGVDNSIGLSNFLRGQVDSVDSIIHRTDNAFFDVLVPGPVPPNPAELLIGNRFKDLLQVLKDRYEVVVLDSPPLGLTNETLYLTRMVDVTIYVLRLNYSKKSFIESVEQLIERKKIPNVYTLLNDVADADLHYHGDGYGYYEDERNISIYRRLANMITSRAAV